MDQAYLPMLLVFALGMAAGALFPRAWWAAVVPLGVPLIVTGVPLLHDPKAGEAFWLVAPFLVVMLALYGAISVVGVAAGRALRRSRK